jgi:simple sugar transport system permease protein
LGKSIYWSNHYYWYCGIRYAGDASIKDISKEEGGRVNMNEAKKMKKSITLPFDDNSKRLIIILVVLLFVTGITKSSQFLNVGNIQSIGKQLTEYGLMSLGMGVCMLSGGIDLSTVYIANLCGISAGLIIQSNTSGAAGIVLACVVALVVGALCGIFNGFLVSFLNIPPMLATLGSYELYMGISIVLSQGSTVSADGRFNILSAMTIFGIPLPFILFLLCTVILTLIMSKTSFGNKVYLVGTNAKSSKFAGINVKKTTLCCYMISGILSAIAGLVSLSRLNSAKADFGTSYTMQTILVAVLGGINPDGGFGNIPGIAFAVIILQTLSSYLNQFPSISNYYRDMIWGVALLAVLVFNITISKKRAKKAASK